MADADGFVAGGRPGAGLVGVDARGFLFRLPNSLSGAAWDAALRGVKELPGRRWDDVRRLWSVPFSSAAAFRELAERCGLRCVDERAARALAAGADVAVAVPAAPVAVPAPAEGPAEGPGGGLFLNAERPAGPAAPDPAAFALSHAYDADITVDLRLRPYRFQLAGIAYASERKRVIIGDQMGLGKTLQAIGAVERLGEWPVLVVAPPGLLDRWVSEYERATGGLAVKLDFRRNDDASVAAMITSPRVSWRRRPKAVMVSYGMVHKAVKVARAARAVIYDEAHLCRNPDTARHRRAAAAGEGKAVRIALTGTPMLNRLRDWTGLLGLIGRMEDFGGRKAFLARYADPARPPSVEEVMRLGDRLRQTCYIRRLADRVLDLPPLHTSFDEVPITTRAAYDAYAAEAAAASGPAARLSALMGLRRLAGLGKVAEAAERARLVMADGEKVGLFVHHLDVAEALAGALGGVPAITGAMPPRRRQAVVDEFQRARGPRALVLGIQAAGVGYDLTAARRGVFVEFDWNPGNNDQAAKRFHRIGQANAVSVDYLVGRGTVDEAVLAMVEAKRRGIDAATEGSVGADGDVEGVVRELWRRLYEAGA